jgi:hypothetical protein
LCAEWCWLIRTNMKNITLFGVDAAKVSTAGEQHDEREHDSRGTNEERHVWIEDFPEPGRQVTERSLRR